MRVVLLDNYDSFTYNLYDYLCRLGAQCTVVRNDAVSLKDIENYRPDALLLSPGPQRPENAGILMEVVDYFHQKLPILGVCLGHQAIGTYFGATLEKAALPVHGKVSMSEHSGTGIFHNLPNPLQVMRYHSLLLRNLPTELEAVAYTEAGELMAMRHVEYPLWGVQFHPESVLTVQGLTLLDNWLQSVKQESQR